MTDFMHGAKYDTKTRHRAAKILATGVGHRALATQLGIPEATARQWSRAYAVGGQSAVMNAGAKHRIYPFELKLSVVKDRLEKGLSVRDVMVKHGVPSDLQSRRGAANFVRVAKPPWLISHAAANLNNRLY